MSITWEQKGRLSEGRVLMKGKMGWQKKGRVWEKEYSKTYIILGNKKALRKETLSNDYTPIKQMCVCEREIDVCAHVCAGTTAEYTSVESGHWHWNPEYKKIHESIDLRSTISGASLASSNRKKRRLRRGGGGRGAAAPPPPSSPLPQWTPPPWFVAARPSKPTEGMSHIGPSPGIQTAGHRSSWMLMVAVGLRLSLTIIYICIYIMFCLPRLMTPW